MIAPQTMYLIIVLIVAIVSIVYRIIKKSFGEVISIHGIMVFISQILCSAFIYYFLTGISQNEYGNILAWMIVLFSASSSCLVMIKMINDI